MNNKIDLFVACDFSGYEDLKMVISDDNTALDEVLRRDFTTVFRPGYITLKGVTMPQRFDELRKDIYDLEVSENDVWVCSFPKTGEIFSMFSKLINNFSRKLVFKYDNSHVFSIGEIFSFHFSRY